MNQIDANELLGRMRALASIAQNGSANPINPVNPVNDSVQSFQSMLAKAVDGVNELSQNASSLVTRFENHDPSVNVTEVMVALQKANISFQAMTQVRNHLVNAYQDIMNMPI